MKEFFKGWQRKTGVMTLVMACVITAAWIRSIRTRDVFQHRVATKSVYFLVSNRSWVYWQCIRESFPSQLTSPITIFPMTISPTLNSFHFEIAADDTNYFKSVSTQSVSWLMDRKRSDSDMTLTVWAAPYWSIVVPLMLLSAWLLISKQPVKQTKDQP